MKKQFFAYIFRVTETLNNGNERTRQIKIFREKKPDTIYLDHVEKINKIEDELINDHFYHIQFEGIKEITRNFIA